MTHQNPSKTIKVRVLKLGKCVNFVVKILERRSAQLYILPYGY